MVAAVTGIDTQSQVTAVGEGNSNAAITTQDQVFAIYNFRAITGYTSQDAAIVLGEGNSSRAIVTQVQATVVYRYRSDDPRVRAWTYTLDGHDYYVLQLGELETLVYDTHSEQWSVFGDADGDIWKLNYGINWTSAGSLMGDYGSNILVGDYANGALYLLDPDYIYDDDRWNAGNEKKFTRFAQGQYVVRGASWVPCYGVSLTASFGEDDAAGLGVSLLYSDNAGRDYTDAGTVTATVGDYAARVEWRSLGSMIAPGRLFRIADDGAVASIDGLELLEDAES